MRSAGADDEQLRRVLRNVDVRMFERDRDQHSSLPNNAARYLNSMLSGRPSWILKRESSELRNALNKTSESWDGIIALGEASAQYFDSDHTWHWDKFNVQSISLRDEFAWTQGILSGVRDLITLSATKRYERHYSKYARSVTVTNDVEASRYRELFGGAPTILHSTVPIPPETNRRPIPRRLLWLGSFGYRSNVDGLESFLRASWPALQEEFTLRIVGSAMTSRHRAWLEPYYGVSAIGYVDDLTEELAAAHLGVVPIWSGGGTKMKTLTMMAGGLPVVSTTSGIEGIPVEDGSGVYIARTPADFASVIADAAKDTLASEVVGDRARTIIKQRFTEAGIDSEYEELLQVLTGSIGIR